LNATERLAAQKVDSDPPVPILRNSPGLNKHLLTPLAVFAPRRRLVNGRMRQDWNISWLAAAIFLFLLASVSDFGPLQRCSK
jgi:hypothetical protein